MQKCSISGLLRLQTVIGLRMHYTFIMHYFHFTWFEWTIFLFVQNWRVAFAKGLQVIIRTIHKDSELICTLSALHKLIYIYMCVYIYISEFYDIWEYSNWFGILWIYNWILWRTRVIFLQFYLYVMIIGKLRIELCRL